MIRNFLGFPLEKCKRCWKFEPTSFWVLPVFIDIFIYALFDNIEVDFTIL